MIGVYYTLDEAKDGIETHSIKGYKTIKDSKSDEVYLLRTTKLVNAKVDRGILRDEELLTNLNLQVPPIVSFINACNKKGHEIYQYTEIHDLIKGVYRDVF